LSDVIYEFVPLIGYIAGQNSLRIRTMSRLRPQAIN